LKNFKWPHLSSVSSENNSNFKNTSKEKKNNSKADKISSKVYECKGGYNARQFITEFTGWTNNSINRLKLGTV